MKNSPSSVHTPPSDSKELVLALLQTEHHNSSCEIRLTSHGEIHFLTPKAKT